MVIAYDACNTASERGALLRREGLYHSRIAAWRQELTKGKHAQTQPAKHCADHLFRGDDFVTIST